MRVRGGLVVTNDHVIGTAAAVSVYLDSTTRVPAQLVARDANADLVLPIASPDPERAR
jgi:S1-C subfamily serine protease